MINNPYKHLKFLPYAESMEINFYIYKTSSLAYIFY